VSIQFPYPAKGRAHGHLSRGFAAKITQDAATPKRNRTRPGLSGANQVPTASAQAECINKINTNTVVSFPAKRKTPGQLPAGSGSKAGGITSRATPLHPANQL